MLPTHQCFGTDNLAGMKIYLRLVVQDQLPGFNGATKLAFGFKTFERAPVHLCRVKMEGVAAGSLGLDHRRVGTFQQFVGALAILGKQGDANTGGQVQFAATDNQWRGNCCQHWPGDNLGHLVAPCLGDNDEFVAIAAGNRVDVGEARRQAFSGSAQDDIARAMAQAIVDVLEAIKVERDDSKGPSRLGGAHDRLGEAIIEQIAVGQPGQIIVVGLAFELLKVAANVSSTARDFRFEAGVLVPQPTACSLGCQLGRHPGNDHFGWARLGDVVGGALTQAGNNILAVVHGGEEDHRNAASRLAFAQAAENLIAVHCRHHDVEQDQAWLRRPRREVQGRGTRVGNADGKAGIAQRFADDRKILGHVVHHQDRRRNRRPRPERIGSRKVLLPGRLVHLWRLSVGLSPLPHTRGSFADVPLRLWRSPPEKQRITSL